jgi:predicted GNAT family N-acyltransferase
MENPQLFRIAETPDELLRCLFVRAIVFMEQHHVSCAEEMDGLDSGALQILGEINGEPVATARIRCFGDCAKLERLAIRKAWRGQGHGDRLVEFMLAAARERGYRKFKLHGQERLRSFYKKHGFRAEGNSFLEADIPHLLMRRED